MLRRVSGNMEALENIYRSGQSCHVLMGHQFNWEWGNAFVMIQGTFFVVAAYSPLSNKTIRQAFSSPARALWHCLGAV